MLEERAFNKQKSPIVKARTWQRLLMLATVSWLSTAIRAQETPVAEPALPEPEWREAESISLFPPRGAVTPASLADDSRRIPKTSAPQAARPSPIPGLPELDVVPTSGGGSGVVPPRIQGIDDILTAPGFGVDPFSQLPELPDITELPDQIKELEALGGGRVIWHVNPRKARKIAAKEGKVFILAFLGLGWNSQSVALEEDVFATEAFKAFAADNVVLAYLDFPSQYQKIHPVFHAFKKKCGVKGFPALVFFGPDGEQFGTIGGYNKRHGPLAYMHDMINRVQGDEIRREMMVERFNRLKQDGFRSWRNTNERTAFLRLRGIANDRAYFEDPEGEKSATPLNRLHIVDREIARREAVERGRLIK